MKFRLHVESLDERIVPDAAQLTILTSPIDGTSLVPPLTTVNLVAQNQSPTSGAVSLANVVGNGTTNELLVSTTVAGPDRNREALQALRDELASLTAQKIQLTNTKAQQAAALQASRDAFDVVAKVFDDRLAMLKKAGWTNAQINNDAVLAALKVALDGINDQIKTNKAAIADTDKKLAAVDADIGQCLLDIVNLITKYPYLATGIEPTPFKPLVEVSGL